MIARIRAHPRGPFRWLAENPHFWQHRPEVGYPGLILLRWTVAHAQLGASSSGRLTGAGLHLRCATIDKQLDTRYEAGILRG
jgi:hypothetical protein